MAFILLLLIPLIRHAIQKRTAAQKKTPAFAGVGLRNVFEQNLTGTGPTY